MAGLDPAIHVIASEAKQSRNNKQDWIASSQLLLAMTVCDFCCVKNVDGRDKPGHDVNSM
ncbi:hypothetical protein YH63_003410 [Afipia massiliensis]|uniref:Uncharacterized protein n=1 Tax=Afipia massiliensis TaxID=211460 RepID=A0A4U6BMA6_9BRAD|nr:hypothetical protein [Afipia massiliensis]TKT70535.1 hypothetical protein YH63_003410 [Afipia massiliensis]